MTDLFYIVHTDDLDNPICEAVKAPLPWYTHDEQVARFTAYTLNKSKGETTYQVKRFHNTPPLALLDVPYLPQWGVGANVRSGDCGPACDAMIVRFLTDYVPTVDVMAQVCDQPPTGPGSKYTGPKQLREGIDGNGGALFYGVTLATRSKYQPPGLTLELLTSQVDAGLPSIALIHYGVLRDETNKLDASLGYVRNQDQNYERGHWVTFIGYDKADVFIHDPDYWGAREHDGNTRRVPRIAFFSALKAVAPGCSVGFQGLVVQRG